MAARGRTHYIQSACALCIGKARLLLGVSLDIPVFLQTFHALTSSIWVEDLEALFQLNPSDMYEKCNHLFAAKEGRRAMYQDAWWDDLDDRPSGRIVDHWVDYVIAFDEGIFKRRVFSKPLLHWSSLTPTLLVFTAPSPYFTNADSCHSRKPDRDANSYAISSS